MQALNGNMLIKAMSRPEWDEEVQQILKICEEERVVLESGEYSKDIYIDKYAIELEFSEDLNSEKQRAEAEAGNLYLQGVSFYEKCTIPLPFGLKIGDDRRTCAQKVHAHTKIVHLFRFDSEHASGDDYLLEDADKKYFFKLGFTLEEHRLEDIVAFVWNIDMDLNRNYMEDIISIEEALK